MLTDKIHIPNPQNEPEDILSSSLSVIFPDDCTNQHGDANTPIIYLSPNLGPINLTLCDPDSESSRKLFSHFQWNAGVLLSEYIDEKADQWSVRGEDVLEVGAGTGLCGMMAALKGAARTVISDYPAAEVLSNIRANVERNVTAEKRQLGTIEVQGHEWGVLDNDDGFVKGNKGNFGRVLVADCLWMPWQHGNLRRSISWFLGKNGRAWVIAGFHTGREKMKGFFEENALREDGLEVEKIWERNADGGEREWIEDRGREDITGRKRWLVVAILKKAGG